MIGILIAVLLAAVVYVILAALTGSAIVAIVGAVLVLLAGIPSGGFGFGSRYGGRAERSTRAGRGSRRRDSNPRHPVYKTGALPLSYSGGVGRAYRGLLTRPERPARG